MVCLTALCLLLWAAVALADDPLAFEMEVSQTTLTGVGTVRVNINVINVSDDDSTISVTLYDPDRKVCSSFGSGGTISLAPGNGASYSGTWTVTQEQLEAGKITYTASYKVTDENGNVNTVSRPIAKTITYQTADAKLNVERTAPSKAVEGQLSKVSFLVTNIGTVDVTDIQIVEADLSDEPLTCPLLAVGDSVELVCEFVMGSEPVTSQPVVTYNYLVGSEEKQNKIDGPAKTIEVATVDVLVQLSAKSLIVNKGDKVDLTCTITNKGDLEYTKLSITDATLGNIESGVTLGAGKEWSVDKSITVNNAGTYQFVVTALDPSGNTVTYASNELTIQTTEEVKDALGDEAIVPDLEIVVEADREVIYSEPSEIAFLIKVTNFGRLAAENVVISEAGTTVKTIDVIQPNETVTFAKMFTTSVGGQIQFVATVKDASGEEEYEFESNIVKVTYVAPAPTPTPTPVPTPVPTPTQEPTPTEEIAISPFDDGEPEGVSTGRVLLYVLAGLLVVILVAVVLLVVMDRRRNMPPRNGGGPRSSREPVNVIDSIERSARRDYAAPRRGTPRSRTRQQDQYQQEDEYGQMPYDGQPGAEEPRVRRQGNDYEREQAAQSYAPPRQEREMRTFDVESGASAQRGARPAQDLGSTERVYDAEPTVAGSDYLRRMRERRSAPDVAEEPAAGAAEEPAEEPATPLSDDEAALLSGSTAQYHISRSTPSLRRGGAQPAKTLYEREAEDPQAFARNQRLSRDASLRKKDEISNYYDDDEEETDLPGNDKS